MKRAWMSMVVSAAEAGEVTVINGSSFAQGEARFSLFDIRTPVPGDVCQEWHNTGQVPYDCGAHAKAVAESLVRGRAVVCVDRSERTKSCYAEGEDIAMILVRRGWAISCRTSGRYDAAEQVARDAQLGLWSGTFRLTRRCP